MKARRDVFQAIADPTRRAIINLVATGPHPVNAIAEKFAVSRQAISLQIQILSDCGMVIIKQQGRNRICEARLNQLGEVSTWIERYREHWESKVDRLENYLEKMKKKKYGKLKK